MVAVQEGVRQVDVKAALGVQRVAWAKMVEMVEMVTMRNAL